MKAVIYDNYGGPEVLRLTERPLPRLLPGQVMIEVHASSVNPIDYRLRRGEMRGLLLGGFPRTPGYDVAGIVADLPIDAPYQPGDRVMAFLDNARGGACAEFAVCSIKVATPIPNSMPFDQAAAIPLAGTTSLQSLRDHGRLKSGERVLVNGGSGGVGMFAIQIAKAYGATVDAVASGPNEAFCKSLGAEQFFDYKQVDFTETGEQWDIVFDAAGKSSYRKACRVLRPGGRYISTEPSLRGIVMSLVTWPLSKSGRIMLAKPSSEDLAEMIRMYEQGDLKVTIDGHYRLAETANAHRRIESGVDRGKVVILHRTE